MASILAGFRPSTTILLGTHLTIQEAASPSATLWQLFVVSCVAAVLVAPSLLLLYILQLRRKLG